MLFRRLQFSIRDLFWCVALVGVGLAWRVENIYSSGSPGTDTYDLYTHDGSQNVMAFHKGTTGAAYLMNRFLWGPIQDQLLTDEQVSSLGSDGTVYWAIPINTALYKVNRS